MYCEQCGVEIKAGTRFCEGCGVPITAAADKPFQAPIVQRAESLGGVRLEQPPRVVVTQTKSVGIAILLTILFGPIGMLYSTIPGAIVMIPVSLVFGLLTLGFGFIIIWPICIIWGAVAADSYNKKLLAGQRPY